MPRTPAVVLGLFLFAAPAPAAGVSFRNEVMAVLSRGGCNQGTCHGNLNGKNGLKLSLRGEDPEFDFNVLTRQMLGRRVDVLRPEASLILLKATATIPHEGGQRFTTESPEYDLLLRWIRAGLPADPETVPAPVRLDVTPRERVLHGAADAVPIRAVARFADGQRRDVTRLAVYEASNPIVAITPGGEVRREQFGETTILVRYLDQQAAVRLAFVPERPGFVWREVPEVNYVDQHVLARLKALHLVPSDLATDPVFLRRVYLDVLGVLPTPDEVRAFLRDTHPDRRGRLIDRLLRRPEFADFWALKWSDLLRNEEKTIDRKGMQLFHGWLRQGFLDGKPLNELARELIAGRGSTYSDPAANYYRALRDPYTRAEATAQVFLGIRVQCARCHNHPFDRWKQDDYHSLAAFFPRIDYRIVENNRRDRLDSHEFDGEQVVYMKREGEVKHPRTGASVAPRFLGAPTPALAEDADRLRALADWVADPGNPFFARAQANRIWLHLMGRGLVDPNDDFRATNPPANEPLLEALTRDLVEHRFDLRHLVRTILRSRTYQLSSTPNDTNADDEVNGSRALIRPLQAEQALDALAQATGVPAQFTGYPLGIRAGQLPGLRSTDRRSRPTPAEQFLKVFGKPERLLSCECERGEDTTLNQAFQLITGETVHEMISARDNRLGTLLAAGKPDRAILEELYLAALSRPPTPRELDAAAASVARAKDRRAALEDWLWGLVNAKEFLLRH